MKRILTSLMLACALGAGLLTPLAFTGCGSTPQRMSYNSLAATGKATADAYQAYIELVVTGKCRTNGVPWVTGMYRDFQSYFQVAVQAAEFSTNFVATPTTVLQKQSQLIQSIEAEKNEPIIPGK